jgi:hypothetical protein
LLPTIPREFRKRNGNFVTRSAEDVVTENYQIRHNSYVLAGSARARRLSSLSGAETSRFGFTEPITRAVSHRRKSSIARGISRSIDGWNYAGIRAAIVDGSEAGNRGPAVSGIE